MVKKKVGDTDLSIRRGFIDPQSSEFSQREQCALLGISRSGLYYEPRKPSIEDIALMNAIDLEYTEHPYYGRRRMTVAMLNNGFFVGQKKVRSAMQMMGLEAIYPKPKLSASNHEHRKYPYLLRDQIICRPNQVWSADITYIPLVNGFGYLFSIIDWYSRYVIDGQLSNLLDTDFCLEALERALKTATPEIFNTDQGVQFTSNRFTQRLQESHIKISMDGKGRAFDNIMVERLWRTVKYEDVYIKKYAFLPEARIGLEKYFKFYNEERMHQSLEYYTPKEVYKGNCTLRSIPRGL